MNKKFIPALLLLTFQSAFAGPFGLDFGNSLKELSTTAKLTQNQNGIYKAQTVPKPHPDFNDYRLVISPSYGLCKIIAWSKPIENDSYGTETASKFKAISETLNTKYGPSKNFDFLKAGGIWNKPREWMMGLYKKERVLTSFWPENESELTDNLSAISLEAIAIGSDSAMLRLAYESKSINQCLEQIKSKNNDSL